MARAKNGRWLRVLQAGMVLLPLVSGLAFAARCASPGPADWLFEGWET